MALPLPFTTGDLVACIALCRQIFNNCMTVNGAPKSYREFGDTANRLKAGLEQVAQVISERNNLAVGANPNNPCEHPNDRASATALSEIISDFSKTLGTINRILKQHPITGDSSFLSKMTYWMEAEGDLNELVNRCEHHITTIKFLLEPLKVKILTDIQESLRNIDAGIMDVALRVSHVGCGIQELQRMLVQFGCEKPESGWEPQLLEILVPETKGIDDIDLKLRNRLISDCGLDLKEVPLPELTRSVVWWLEKGRIDEPNQGTLNPLRYLNLRKAAWIVRGLQEHQVFQNPDDPKSLWHSYCQRLKEEVDEVLKPIRAGTLEAPSTELVLSLEASEFTVLVEFDDLETDDLASERPDEELILDISLPGVSQIRPIRMLVFRQGTGLLRCVEVVRTKIKGMIQENIKEYIIRRSEWALRPFYVFDPEIEAWNLALYNSTDTKIFTFGSSRAASSVPDLFSFQHAFTGAQVIYAGSGYISRPLIEPPNFKRIEYQESGFSKSTRKFTSGLLQLWLEKPRSRHNSNSSAPLAEPSLSPTISRSATWSSTPSISASSVTATIRQESPTTTVVRVNPVEDSRVFAYMMNEKGTRTFLTFTMGDHIAYCNTSCCGSYLRSVPTQESEICCLKLVIETKVHGGKFPAQVLEAPKNDDRNNLPGIRLDEKRLPSSKVLKLSWFAITFEKKIDKLNFIMKYHMLEKIRRARVNGGRNLLSSVRSGEREGGSPGAESESLPSSPIRRDSTFSNFTFSEKIRLPSYSTNHS